MKKIIHFISCCFIFINCDFVFSQNCTNNVDLDFQANYDNAIAYLTRTAIVPGTNNDFIIAAKGNSTPTPFLRKFDFNQGQPCSSPVVDTNFETTFQSNLPASNFGTNPADLEEYDTDLFALLMSNGTNYISLINANGQASFFSNYGFSGFSGSDIACDHANGRIYTTSKNGSSVIVAIYQIINNNIFLIRSLSYAASSPSFPRLELIPNSVQGEERLVLSYSSLSGKTISVFRPSGYYNSNTTEVLASPFNNQATQSEILSLNNLNAGLINLELTYTTTFGTNSSIRALEYNTFNNRLYIAGHEQVNGSKVFYFDFQPNVNTQFPIDNLVPATSFSSLCGGGYVNSLGFLADCRIVVAGAFTTNANCFNSVVGNSVVIDGNTGEVLNGPLNNTGTISDITTYSALRNDGTICESFFAAGQQEVDIQIHNYRFFTRFCVPDSSTNVSPRFDYCKINNNDGTYTVNISNISGNLTYTLNGNSITNLNNLNGTLIIRAESSFGCSNLMSCYQETITNGTNCSSADKSEQPKSIKNEFSRNEDSQLIKGKYISVYPNPSKDVFNIKANFDQNKDVEVDIFDLQAKSILKKTIHNFDNQGEVIDLKKIQPGTYIIALTQGTTKITQTIIKE